MRDRIVTIWNGGKDSGLREKGEGVGEGRRRRRERERSHQCFLNCVRTISWKKTSTFVPESILISSNVNLWMDVSRHYQTGWIVPFGMCHVSSRGVSIKYGIAFIMYTRCSKVLKSQILCAVQV